MNQPRTSVITDWRVRDENALPDVSPGETFERVIAFQKFVVLRRILVNGMSLSQLQIGTVEVPFELETTDGPVRIYRPRDLESDDLAGRLIAVGAKVATNDSIAVAPGLEIRSLLRNEGTTPAKPRIALLVLEEVSR